MDNYIFASASESLKMMLPSQEVFVIADTNVLIHNSWIEQTYDTIAIEVSEAKKNIATVENIVNQLLEKGATRDSFLVGIGGGITTDIVGFVGSTFMRGIKFGFVPTTVLAQADAAIGGKNGVNIKGYKNIIGTFNMPEFVICDCQLLTTLPLREVRAGMAEILKSAVIGDAKLFKKIANVTMEQITNDNTLLAEMIKSAADVKLKIVTADPYEKNDRQLLNLGHTFAHAIEKDTTEFSHGEAVAIGICMAATMSYELGITELQVVEKLLSVVEHLGLPTEYLGSFENIRKYIAKDKKRHAVGVNFVLPVKIGQCIIKTL